MVGMIQILTWLLRIYLVFKAVEIYQIADMSTAANKERGRTLGGFAIGIAIVVAAIFIVLINSQAESIGSALQNTLSNR